MITLGAHYRDTLTNFTGIAVATGDYLDGSKQVCLRPLGSEELTKQFQQWFDAARLEQLSSK